VVFVLVMKSLIFVSSVDVITLYGTHTMCNNPLIVWCCFCSSIYILCQIQKTWTRDPWKLWLSFVERIRWAHVVMFIFRYLYESWPVDGAVTTSVSLVPKQVMCCSSQNFKNFLIYGFKHLPIVLIATVK